MADLLTHLFLPLTAAYVLQPDRFPSPAYLALGGLGVLADLDKLLGQPGLLHSLVTLVPIAGAILLVERWWRGSLRYGPLVSGLVLSHLVLDFVDGGPVPLLFPVVEAGVGLQYPARAAFGSGPLGMTIEGPLLALRTAAPRSGFNTYGLIDGFGVASMLLFALVYAGLQRRSTGDAA